MMEKDPFFNEICSKLAIDSAVRKSAYLQFAEVSRNTILDGDMRHWICCALFTACIKQKIPTVVVSDTFVQGNGISLVKLINECNLNIYTFFEKIEIWFKVSSVPNAIQQKVEVLKRNFQLSQLIYKDFMNMFAKLFKCNDGSTNADEPKTKSRKKASNVPISPQKLFEMCWTLFVCVKGYSPNEKPSDLVASINLLLCCIDLMFTNVININRTDLINTSFPGLPKSLFTASYDAKKEPEINIIDKLSDDSIIKMKSAHWELIIRRFLTDKNFQGEYNNILSVENFESNFKKLNDLYETFILSCGQFDERIFLYAKPAMQQSMNSQLIPQTPLSHHQDVLHHTSSSSKLSPISSYKQNVQKLQALYNQCQPSNALKVLLCSGSDSILNDLAERLERMKETFCTKMMPNGQDRFQIAEALYYRLLENIINSEMKTHGRFDLFINDDVFNQTLIVLCLEIVLFAFSLHKKLTTLLECFNMEAFHFYKLIEVVIRNNKDYFTNDIIKHLKAIEEQCLDSLAWVSGSLLWQKIGEINGKLPTNQEVSTSQPSNSQNSSPSQTPKSIKLFFRKFYQLAHLRLQDLHKNLQFTNNTDLLRKIWTLFEYAILEHTSLMKDRHLDQILMCCVYVLCKIRPNENRHTFADIMKFYRNQPQSDSHIYRSVFIEYVQTDKANEMQEPKASAAEPEVVNGRNTIYGTESRGDIIYFYNKIFVPKMQQFAMRFSTSSQNNLLLSPLPQSRPLISPRKKISPYHDVYVQPLTKQSILSPSARTLTFTIEQSPSKDLQKINSMINQNKKASVAKRFMMDTEDDFRPAKVSKDSSLQLRLLIDREEISN
ncbi:hypothetical protein PVAND_008046 [Polypedilum vanderplanki]|uniref:Uncharacterized protein n=1 Tax=Polypedilum vanderplanki TaxID=319348 RepID=A0A9J6C883_POLVA|nr:hypothetical protein PVAND_008046 [Polypedilum vanderplanki]